ncbi:MAG: T9SS type A sorting domain-containing protein [Chitinophagales bacterium]|nr:T9SS type A sorting domain-containing protein [Bacteroidota bacterium]MBK8487579.1 T9SS type A sorting domain-containing protein [Bacteroidota bacterium]MBK8682675.1 T9SS type A sorting domain-containing protein [Bacteroidota bacterium]
MKKIYVLFACILGVYTMQAQISSAGAAGEYPLIPRADAKTATKAEIMAIKGDITGSSREADLTYYWINYNDAIDMAFNGGTLENISFLPLWPDSTVKVIGNDAGTPYEFYWWVHSFADMLDPTSFYISNWVDDTYTVAGNSSDWFNKDHAFRVDSVRFYYLYERHDNTVTDTLRVFVMGPGSTVHQFSTLGDPSYQAVYFRYWKEENRPNGTFTAYDILLNDADTASINVGSIQIPLDILIPKAPTGNNNKISIAFSYHPGQEYAAGDTLLDFNDPPLAVNQLNSFWLATNEEYFDGFPTSMDDGAYNQAGAATSEVRYGISTTGWNGYYVNTFAFLSTSFAWEHAYIDWHLAPEGANFQFTTPSPCVDLTKEFIDFTNFIDAPASASYFWDFDDGTSAFEQNPTHTFPSPGTYQVCLVATEASVSYQQCKNVTVDFCSGTGFESFETLSNFTIYPNPANDAVNINLDFTNQSDVVISIFNAQGQTVYSVNADNITNYSKTIDVSSLSNGLYMVQIAEGNKLTSKNFIIAR